MPVKKAIRIIDSTVEFIQYDGSNIDEIAEWVGDDHIERAKPNSLFSLGSGKYHYLKTPLGSLPLYPGDYVLQMGQKFYLWKEAVFERSYSVVDE